MGGSQGFVRGDMTYDRKKDKERDIRKERQRVREKEEGERGTWGVGWRKKKESEMKRNKNYLLDERKKKQRKDRESGERRNW